ncbi:MAG TPA: hypothetical protein VLG71_02025 [Candidatus Limnocylindria bacterium]|nr:hypothetical protein [Candidatus Limnocylindria bacterium]
MNSASKYLAFLAFCSTLVAHAADNPHMYRATFFYGEPRLEKRALGSIDILASGGRTCCGRNGCNIKVPLLDIYGTYNMHALGNGVPGKNLSLPTDLALTNLSLTPTRNCFADLSFRGKFDTSEIDISLTQNFVRGFFAQLYIPLRSLRINNINFADLSPTSDPFPNINTPTWQTFLNVFPAILEQYNLSIDPVHRRGIGDISLMAGWTLNYQEFDQLDYMDMTIKLGILAPTGKKANPNIVFDLPLGYNGHTGFPFELHASFGAFDWFTFGAYLGGIAFGNRTGTVRIRTDAEQSGLIKLASVNCACIHQGVLWNAGLFAKADHFCRGLSALVGYTFVQHNCDCIVLSAQDRLNFDPVVVNDDPILKGWNMHTLHFMVDYDFSQPCMKFGPRLGFFYNFQFAGKRTFNTSTAEGTFGLDIAWDF